MTTAAQVKRLFKPMLVRHEDLAIAGRFLHIKPTRHIARGFFVGRTSSRDYFSLYAVTAFLGEFLGAMNIDQSILLPSRNSHSWSFSEPRTQQWLDDCIEEHRPDLRKVDTVEAYVDYANDERVFDSTLVRGPPLKDRNWPKVYVDVALGDLAAAEETCRLFQEREARSRKPFPFDGAPITTILVPMVYARDIAGLAAQLHAWEAASVKVMKLEPYWEPSPFPLERGCAR